MKRIVVLMLALCSLCAVCFAKLEQPTDERWVIVGGDDKNEIWIDIGSVYFGRSKEIGHSNHKASQIWYMMLDFESNMKGLMLVEYDFDCRTMRQVSTTAYNEDGQSLGTTRGSISGEPIIPGSVGEEVYSVVTTMDELKNDPEKYDLYINLLKEFTKEYKKGNAL